MDLVQLVPRFLNYGILTFFYTRIFEKAEYGVVTELYAWMVLSAYYPDIWYGNRIFQICTEKGRLLKKYTAQH